MSSCQTCQGTRRVIDDREELIGRPGSWSGHAGRAHAEEIDCPDCCFRCLCCNDAIWRLQESGHETLRYYDDQHWCSARCLGLWLKRHESMKPRDRLQYLLVAKHNHTDYCGCAFPDASHSNGCHALVDELNDMIKAATAAVEGV